ncbi:hypothetical protein FACS18942_10290 [Planctomycetales bacterium]|nr:hypothetical protein FACS18942_10290 [Planctomycetales bacterium]GHT38493.1 hypothetical protein FACS189427_12620 [Planctomycetales bacterium]
MSIISIAKDAVAALNLVPAENIGVQAVYDADWQGETKIIISEEQTTAEDETQEEPLSYRTVLNVYCGSKDRNTACDIGRAAANAVYAAFVNLERKSGLTNRIFSITKNMKTISNVPGREEFEAGRSFNIIHNLNS